MTTHAVWRRALRRVALGVFTVLVLSIAVTAWRNFVPFSSLRAATLGKPVAALYVGESWGASLNGADQTPNRIWESHFDIAPRYSGLQELIDRAEVFVVAPPSKSAPIDDPLLVALGVKDLNNSNDHNDFMLKHRKHGLALRAAWPFLYPYQRTIVLINLETLAAKYRGACHADLVALGATSQLEELQSRIPECKRDMS